MWWRSLQTAAVSRTRRTNDSICARWTSSKPTPIRGTEGDTVAAGRSPFFSPDGRWIGFWQEGQLKKVSITGGAPLVLCAAENPWGVSWTSDNTILYGQSEQGAGKGAAGIWRVSSEGGKPEHVVKVEAGQIAHGPQLLPGGRAILFTLARRGEWDTAQIVVQSLDSGRRHVVVERGADARYVPTGHLVYALGGTLLAVPFDVTMLAVTGAAVPLVEDVAQQNVTAHFAISSQGALVYVPRDAMRIQRATDAGVGRSPRPRGLRSRCPLARISIHDCHPTGRASRLMSAIRKTTSGSGIWRVRHSRV